MLVKPVVIRRFITAAVLAVSVVFSAHADPSACQPTDVFYDGVAQKALTNLQALSPKLQEYNNHVQQVIFDQNGACYAISMYVDRSPAKSYTWSGFDAGGTSQSGNATRDEIKQLMSGMDFKYIDFDFAAYEYKNNSLLSAANIALKTSQSAENQQKLTQDVQTYQKCRAELFNLSQEQSTVKDLRDKASSFLTTLSSPQTTTCTCDESGTLTSCSTISESPEEESSKLLSCKNLSEYNQDTAFCPTCIIFERILMADQKLAGGAFGVLADSLIKILTIGFLLFLAYQTLVLVSSPANQPMSKYLTSLLVQGFKVTVAILILTSPTILFDLILRPVLEGSLDFGLTLTGKAQAAIEAAGAKYTKFDTANAMLTAPFLQKMVGAAEVFNEQAALMPAMGRAMICDAFANLDWNVIPNIETLLEGLLVVIFGYIISLSVGFYLLDITVELGFFCCLLPFLITCWPFKITNRYTKVGWNIFMHIFFTFVMLGVVITVINAIIKRSLAPNHDVKDLINALNTNDFEAIKQLMDIGGSQMLFLIVACYICLKLLKDINNLSNKFAGGAGFNISPSIGGLGASALIATGKTGGSALFKGITSATSALGRESGATGGLKALGGKASDALGFSKMRNYYQQLKGKAGIGANAQARGGRAGNSSNPSATTNNNTSGGGQS